MDWVVLFSSVDWPVSLFSVDWAVLLTSMDWAVGQSWFLGFFWARVNSDLDFFWARGEPNCGVHTNLVPFREPTDLLGFIFCLGNVAGCSFM